VTPLIEALGERIEALGERIEAETGAFVTKPLLAYEEALVEWKGKDLSAEGLLPEDVVSEQKRVQKSTNPFTTSSNCKLGEQKVEWLSKFQKAFYDFCRQTNRGPGVE
jgi:hypothetical protein